MFCESAQWVLAHSTFLLLAQAMIQYALGPLLSKEQLRSCLIGGFEARKAAHGFVAADQCNSPKEWIKVLSAVNPQLWFLAPKRIKKASWWLTPGFLLRNNHSPFSWQTIFITWHSRSGEELIFLGILPQSLQPRSAGRSAELLPTPATRTSPLSSRTTAVVSASSSPALPAVIWAHNSAPHA